MRNPTPEEVFHFIKEFHSREGFAPTLREMSHHYNRSTSVIWRRLLYLQANGKLHHLRGKARAIALL